jgi:hypothetical protein
LPFTPAEHRADIRDNLFQSYIAAREADLPVALAREVDGLDVPAKLFLLPSTKLLAAPTARRLSELAAGGALVYMSYFQGSNAVQRGSWVPWLRDIFGVKAKLRYGLVDAVPEAEVTFTFTDVLGDIGPGDEVSFNVAGNASARAFLPLEVEGASIVAVDHRGRPALVRQQVGSGSTVLCAYPIEHMAAHTPGVNPEGTWRLYSALAVAAGVELPISADDPRAMAGLLRNGEKELALVVNLSADDLEVTLRTTGGASYHKAGDRAPVEKLALAPFEVEALVAHRRRP